MHDLGEKTLYSCPFKYGFYAIICFGFTVGGVWMGCIGQWMGYVCAAFFGLGLIVLIVQMLPGASYLQLTAEGFEFASMYRRHFVAWKDIHDLGVWTVQKCLLAKTEMVCFNYEPTFTGMSGAREFSRNLSGFEAGLPDAYGLKADELLSLMKRYWHAAREREF